MMRSFILSLLCLTAFSCDKAGEPIVPDPGDVKMVEHTAADDTMAVERGIDAIPESDGIFLAWYALKEEKVNKYKIWRKGSESFFDVIKIIDPKTASPGKDTTFVDDNGGAGLPLGDYYYEYFVTATNEDGKESSAIDTVHYMLIPKPDLLRSDKDTYILNLDNAPILYWQFVDPPTYYILRIENTFNQLQYVHIFDVLDFFPDQTLDLNDSDRVPDPPEFQPGLYKWRIDIIGPDEDHSGAESNWAFFTIE
jgi:hypothetical protein